VNGQPGISFSDAEAVFSLSSLNEERVGVRSLRAHGEFFGLNFPIEV
jgi:hypothetical protein